MKTFAIGAAALVASVVTAGAQETTLRLSHWVPATHPVQTTGIEPWAESISEASNGEIAIQIFPAQQLGAAPDHYDMVRDGIVDIAWVNPGYNAGRFPIFELTGVPFESTSGTKGAKAIHEWYKGEYSEKEMGDVYFCLVNPHDTGRFHSKDPVKVPSDVDGLNVRPAHATMARFINSLGGSSVQVPAPEAREALARGTADAITFPYESITLFGIDKITKFHNDMPFYMSAQLLLINKNAYERLSDEGKQVIDDHCTPEWSEQFSLGWTKAAEDVRQELIDNPEHEVYQPTEEEVELWREAAKPVMEAWKKDAAASGVDADEVLANYRKALEANDTKY
ncbi:TRAP transporter substrate-binding protein [Amorphus orientalis]|uniref:TRAP-type C4-dicarboxylate transport system substrate-binding protein n=1 Tax=Amorphus orientalis TaxID=649198 RepID=A0AAE3VMD2_9HYPH|nr:TRAP transporter substrate-binding protein [Amorphus orientalis]MDQ0314702.1 TRAP-type C4-dicarboxylate transport system substrate-binding protein [Amorphus orientalis]